MKMKKIMTMCVSVAMAATTLLGVGCGGGGGGGDKENKIVVNYYKGGYGSAWIEKSAADFKAQTGITVELVSSQSLDAGAPTPITSGRNLSDMYICATSDWVQWAQDGKLADLSSVYNTEVTTKTGKAKVGDVIDQGIKDKFYLEKTPASGNYLPWAMPWSVSIKALVYNEDILKQVTHNSANGEVNAKLLKDGKWIAPPETMAELQAYFADVKEFDAGQGKIVPFGWTGANPEGFFNFLYPVWGEVQGVKTSKIEGEGSYYDFWNLGNTVAMTSADSQQQITLKGYDQTGLKEAIGALQSLIKNPNGNGFVNGLPDADDITAQDLQKVIVAKANGTNCAVAVGSSYLEYEASNNGFTDSDSDGKQDYQIRFMAVPSLKEENRDTDLCYTPVGDVMVIPAKANNVEGAKQFLAFMCNYDQLAYFTKVSGSLRPFNYDAREIEGAEYTPFTQSVFDVFYNSTHLYELPLGVEQNKVSYVYRYQKISILGGMSPGSFYKSLGEKSAAEIVSNVKTELKKGGFNDWINLYNLDNLDD